MASNRNILLEQNDAEIHEKQPASSRLGFLSKRFQFIHKAEYTPLLQSADETSTKPVASNPVYREDQPPSSSNGYKRY